MSPIFISLFLATAPTDSSYPAVAVLDAFQNACSDYSQTQNETQRLKKAGWSKASFASASDVLAHLKSRNKTLGSSDKLLLGRDLNVMSRVIGNQQLFLVLRSIKVRTGKITNCLLIDFNRAPEISPKDVVDWVGRPATDSFDDGQGVILGWEPENNEKCELLSFTLIPASSWRSQKYKFSGIEFEKNIVERIECPYS